ncbi:MAG: alcohol dehydrogenase [Deltaproteobacteria bacterium]|jgi:NADPH:quinone reductase-like Zn-dependent oxidoreductase|nr:MAG: alcohol dehydrogenase [Deltaproteobacteria bacterium]
MKAVVIYEHGDVDKLKYDEIPDPVVRAGDVLVQVKACAMNHLDIWVRKGFPGLKVKYPHILGSDVAGVVVSVGEDVKGIELGTPVMVSPGISCGRCVYCLSGRDNLCREYAILGENCPGGCAEYVSVPKENILPMPKNLSFEEAACIPLVFLTAWHMLVTRAQIKPGEVVLVHAAGSGVGSAAIQIAKLFGATVITTAGTDEKLEKAKNLLGADYCINYKTQDFVAEVRKITEKRGVDIIIDHTGDVNWEKNILSLTMGGRMVVCGATSGYEGKTDIRYVFFRRLSILGSTMGSKGELFEVVKHVESGRLKPVLHKVLPMSQVAEGHRLMESRDVFGKIVLIPS